MKTPQLSIRLAVFASLILGLMAGDPGIASPSGLAEAIAVIRQDCSGNPGPEPCYTSLAAWQADFGSIDFGAATPGDLVVADLIATARIEEPGLQPDTAPLNLSGWTTDASHFIRIYTTPEARHSGTPGSGYRLQTSGEGPIYGSVAYFRLEGLEISGDTSDSLIYLNRNTSEGVGEIYFSHNLIHGNAVNTASGLMSYSLDGMLYAWNNVIDAVGEPGYTAGIPAETRTYALTGLTNYEWYSVTLTTNPPMLTDIVSVMPTDTCRWYVGLLRADLLRGVMI